MKRGILGIIGSTALALAGCGGHAPVAVIERSPEVTEKPLRPATPVAPPPAPATASADGPVYVVKKGDTLYSIALDQGKDYKDIAAWNQLENPNLIKIGQTLRLTSPDAVEGAPVAVARPIAGPAAVEVKPVGSKPVSSTGANTEGLKREPRGGKLAYSEEALARAKEQPVPTRVVDTPPEPRPVEVKPAEKPVPEAAVVAADAAIEWNWPSQGKLLAGFSEGNNKGIDIAAKTGEPVHATAAGKVVYAGTGLRGYGKLVIVRHNAEFLSAYAHNNQILVKEGQAVTARQVIAEAGSTDADSPRLHFEIRRQGKPVDPIKFLPAR